MWIDDASKIDMLFYTPYAETIAEFAEDPKLSPLTVGLYGSWGSGKSSLLHLIEKNLLKDGSQTICITMNAWQFEGYEDAKIAIMESLLKLLLKNKGIAQKTTDAIKALVKRVDFIKLGTNLASKGLPFALSAITGNPIPLAVNLTSTLSDFESLPTQLENFKESYLKSEEESSQTENVRKFREEFAKMLNEMENLSSLVVIIDDLDRCSPERIIDTLEAVKLFLAVPKTTFIVAVDQRIIEYAVDVKYPKANGVEISNDYIEKIIQLPIKIPELSPKDIENYMFLLVLQLHLDETVFGSLLENVSQEKMMLRETPLTINEFKSTIENFPQADVKLEEDTKVISEISGTVSTSLKGNPRQAKRFLNTFFMRKRLASLYFDKEEIDLSILAKLLALETIDISAFRKLHEWNANFDGCIEKLKYLEEICADNEIDATNFTEEYLSWDKPRLIRWIRSEPNNLSSCDLSKYYYLSRESLVSSDNISAKFTEEEKNILSALLECISGQEDTTISELLTKRGESQTKIVEAVLVHFKDGSIRLNIISRIYLKYVDYRHSILELIKEKDAAFFGPGCVPHLSLMMNESGKNITSLTEELVKLGKMKASVQKMIIGGNAAFTHVERSQ